MGCLTLVGGTEPGDVLRSLREPTRALYTLKSEDVRAPSLARRPLYTPNVG